MHIHQYQPQGMQPAPQVLERTVERYKTFITHHDGVNRWIARNYLDVGTQYHCTPLHIRFNKVIPAGDRTDLVHNFIISDNREMPELIQSIGKIDMLICEANALLAVPADQVDLSQVEFLIAAITSELPQSIALIRKLGAAMERIIGGLIDPEWARGGMRGGSADNKNRQTKMRDRWFDVLPDVSIH